MFKTKSVTFKDTLRLKSDAAFLEIENILQTYISIEYL